MSCSHKFLGANTCALCGWALPRSYTPIVPIRRPEPVELATIRIALLEQRDRVCNDAHAAAHSMRALLEEAFQHELAGEKELRNRAVLAACDVEYMATRDIVVLLPLAELWGVDLAIDMGEVG